MIRPATHEDISAILGIYTIARKYMTDNGNPSQWAYGYPERKILIKDIERKQLFVSVEDKKIHGVFAFIVGPDATYSHIENGSWKNEDLYGTIHRIASDGVVKGLFLQCVDFCKEKISNLRIDTHSDNHTMQHLIEKNGFEKCGIIYAQNGTPRIAYQYTRH